jgi:hypothetical protein
MMLQLQSRRCSSVWTDLVKYRGENLYIIVLYINDFVISPLERSKAISTGL